MSTSHLVNFENVYQELAQFDCIIDVRSPAEFAEDHIPGALNCPVLDDAERVKVGTLYKQVSPFEAKKIGAALVAQNIGKHIQTHFHDKPKEWKPLIYCWRGGNRSGALTHIMSKIGWHAKQLEGGYKSFRRHINQSLPLLAEKAKWRVLCGETGTGKSKLLRCIGSSGVQIIDLENLARHRGSILGELPLQTQPSQKYFETAIWQQLSSFDLCQPIYVEAESKKIGKLRVPEAMMSAIRQASCIRLRLPIDKRIELLRNEYQHFVEDKDRLNQQLQLLTILHSKQQIQRWTELVDSGDIHELIQQLLSRHYDPAYDKSILRNFPQYQNAPIIEMANLTEQTQVEIARKIINAEN
ncbi:tRNA 2-selenouridine(34) synthase MnmH [Undibacterium fentianense]|uniref:tRNA 2-selenouridine(34) synthase MnmH n=1 Tax=Undibacterium fentianense TaxID=2828728 RepID=A0A941E0A4_9BURK|nr:tRNA 2-selenouridine(34) synthase MnmH [Undibacterium fentianense]MBR7798981.1 tRNA 2-selenouridine(34) synthase MnmH [Undibacterium fentianense]